MSRIEKIKNFIIKNDRQILLSIKSITGVLVGSAIIASSPHLAIAIATIGAFADEVVKFLK